VSAKTVAIGTPLPLHFELVVLEEILTKVMGLRTTALGVFLAPITGETCDITDKIFA
jgi:hypothetical protein